VSAFEVKEVVGGRIHGVCAWTGAQRVSRIVAQSENGGCVRDSEGNWYGVIKDGRIGLELEEAYERDVLKRTKLKGRKPSRPVRRMLEKKVEH
jgi:hypothetical protein